MAAAKTQQLFSGHSLKHNITKTESGSEVHSYTSDLGADIPILTLIHGYPQSAYEWRYLAPILKDKVSLFIPELPGYGTSSPQEANDKRAIGTTLLNALIAVFGKNRKVILGGHDRGARICHRLAVDAADFPLTILGVVMLDIVPTLVQWQAFSNPKIVSGYFHWPMLANVDLATQMINAFGAGNWVRGANQRIAGPSDIGKARVAADGALDVYAELFEQEGAIKWSCEDYRAGAQEDVAEQEADQKAGRKIHIPTLVLFSKSRLGATMDCAEVWKEWIAPGVDYEGIAVGEERGHYLPEEAYETVSEAMIKFIKKVT
jgi:pimeloyl-ACP methyl ester carboxylesterase